MPRILYGVILFGINPRVIMRSELVKQLTQRDGYEGHLFFPRVSDAVMLLFSHINDVKMARNNIGFEGVSYDDNIYACYLDEYNDVSDIKRADDFPPYALHDLSTNDETPLSNYFSTSQKAGTNKK